MALRDAWARRPEASRRREAASPGHAAARCDARRAPHAGGARAHPRGPRVVQGRDRRGARAEARHARHLHAARAGDRGRGRSIALPDRLRGDRLRPHPGRRAGVGGPRGSALDRSSSRSRPPLRGIPSPGSRPCTSCRETPPRCPPSRQRSASRPGRWQARSRGDRGSWRMLDDLEAGPPRRPRDREPAGRRGREGALRGGAEAHRAAPHRDAR